MSCDVYRPLKKSDCQTIAAHYNRSRDLAEPIWCSTGEQYNADKIWRHKLALWLRGAGKIISQVHTQDGIFLSYFGGYHKSTTSIYSIGIINLDTPDPMEIWRQDAAYSFTSSLEKGTEVFKITSSSDQGQFVNWMEQEIGMQRIGGKKAWQINRQQMSDYLVGLNTN